MGWTNNQSETIVGLAFTYFTTTVLFSTGSAVTFGTGSTLATEVDLNITSPAGIVWDGALRVDRDAGGIDVGGRGVLTATGEEINMQATTDAMSSAVYIDVDSAAVTITKRAVHTGLIVFVNTSAFTAVSTNTGVQFGVSANGGADQDVGRTFFETTGMHKPCSGIRIIEDGSPIGAYTIQLRWKRYIGTGTIGQNTNHDINNILVMEG